MVYIWPMIDFPRHVRRCLPMAAGLLFATALAANLGACGGGDVSQPAGETHRGGAETVTNAPAARHRSSPSRPADESRSRRRNAAVKSRAEPEANGSAPPGREEARRAARVCPRGLSRSECEAAVKALARRSPSQTLTKPRDCLETMSKEQCEAMSRAIRAADGEAGGSVNVEECVRNPTPHCEEVLRPILEAQYAASQEAGK